jgi:hypothetical protein
MLITCPDYKLEFEDCRCDPPKDEIMTIERVSAASESGGAVAGNQHATELWRGEVNGKRFEVLLDSVEAPKWDGGELDEDEQTDVMNELNERSGL